MECLNFIHFDWFWGPTCEEIIFELLLLKAPPMMCAFKRFQR